MCNNCNDPFHGLDDDLSDLFVAPTRSDAAERLAAAPLHVERCPNCRGTGNWRPGYRCFKCKGSGKLSFKTSADVRAKAADRRAIKADEQRIQLQADRNAWIEANPADFAWMKAKEETFEFARSMYDALMRYGYLTEKQHATVIRLREADAERAKAREAERAQRAANAPVVSLAKLEEAFAAAMSNGIKRPKLRLDTFKFSLAPSTGRNAGAIYVVDAASDAYLGKIADGKFQRVRECTTDQESRIVAVMSDPRGAAIAYGRRTGNCCICGRELTNSESIDLGIGPICAGKMGW